jgi:hypothetical protein
VQGDADDAFDHAVGQPTTLCCNALRIEEHAR